MTFDDEVFKVVVSRGAEAFSNSEYVVTAKTSREALEKVLQVKPGMDDFVSVTISHLGGELID